MKKFLFALMAMACLGAVGTASAATKYKTTFTAKTDFQSQDWGGGKVTVGTLKGVMETHGSSDTSAVPNGQGIQNCVIRSARINDALDITANCSLTDKDGDVMHLLSERKQGDISAGTGGKGKSTMMGGTGKYKSAKGSCEYTSKYMPENWLVVESECTRD